MSRTMVPDLEALAGSRHLGDRTARRCCECNYDLRGTPVGRPCPECGVIDDPAAVGGQAELAWNRSVAVGLVLLLLVTVYGTASVLVQPFTDEFAGTLPALNVPGPKLWAVPLLQRPIGNSPEWPGMIGTRAALVSLLALWLVTAPRSGEAAGDAGSAEPDHDRWVRPAARWVSLVLFGVAFGVLVASHGVWPVQLPPYRFMLVAGVELPASGLLYAHLLGLSRRAPGRDRRRLFEVLRWLVPLLVGCGAALVLFDWQWGDRAFLQYVGHRFALAAGYGAAAVTCGMMATAAVGSLAVTFCAAAFPNAWRVVSGSRRAARAAWRWAAGADGTRVHFACVVIGLLLLVVAAVLGNEQVMWIRPRRGMAGTLPFFNFPGPKFWAAAAVPELGRQTWWEPIVSRVMLGVLNLAAIWLVTTPTGMPEGRAARALRRAARWSPVVALGAAMGAASAWQGLLGPYDTEGGARSEFFAAVTVLCELPPTVLLYAYLSRVAAAHAPAAKVSRSLVALAVIVPCLVGLSMSGFVLSARYGPALSQPTVLAFCGPFGAAALVTAMWAAVLLVRLAWALRQRHLPGPERQRKWEPVFREVPGPVA